MNEQKYAEVLLWVPRECPLGENGEIIARDVSYGAALALNEAARQYGGHVQACLPNGGYVNGCYDEPGFGRVKGA
jgi:hypothetical protein